MEWIDIPAQRVLKLTRAELLDLFELVAEVGYPSPENFVLVERKRDRKVFRGAKVIPVSVYSTGCIYLEEV